MKRIVIALGGNALQQKNEEATSENQIKNIMNTAKYISKIVKAGYEVIITHGNGPQVGRLLLQNEAAKHITPPMPMDVCGAMTQGMIGYHIQQCMKKVFEEENIDKQVCTVVTQVEVNKSDQAFSNPTKPVGPFYTEEEAKQLGAQKGYVMKKDANRGYRRVVSSPIPVSIVEIDSIKTLVKNDVIVVTVGGGGVPVIRENGCYAGVEAVIDKDFASEVLAEQLDADVLMILTEVENVAINFGKENEKKLHRVTVEELTRYKDEGHFAPGSMLPKIEAAIHFAESGKGRKAIITSLEKALDGLNGKSCTTVIN